MFENNNLLKRLRFLIEVSLTLGLAFICSQIVWQIFAPSQQVSGGIVFPDAQQTAYADAQHNSVNLAILTQTNPFTPRSGGQQEINSAALEAPETGLNLTLKGVRANGDGQGVAFVLLPDNRQLRTEVGGEILDGVKIEYVFEDRITLRTRGKLETLYLRKPDSETTSLIRRAPDNSKETGQTRPPSEGTNQAIVASDLLRAVSLAVVREDGRRVGYRVTPRGDTSILEKAGLEAGDVIKGVNNRSVSDVDSEDLIETLRQAKTTEIEVERAGKPLRISVRFAQGTP